MFLLQIWWLIAINSDNFNLFLIGRLLSGITIGGAYTLVPLYIAEIAHDKIRGSLNAVFIFAMNSGMLMIYVAGEVFDFHTTQKIFLCINFAFFGLFWYFPETPPYLIRNSKSDSKVKLSLKFYSGIEAGDDVDYHEKYAILSTKLFESFKTEESTKKSSREPVAIKAILYGTIMITCHQLSGLMAFVGYSADIFRESGSSLSPNLSAIIVGVLLIIGSFISIVLVDKFPRKSLYMKTTLGNIIGLILMGFYELSKQFIDKSDTFKFIPILALSIVIFASTTGRLPLTYIIVTEIQPQFNRSIGISICSAVNWLVAFIMLQFFSTAIEHVGFHNCMFIFSIILFFSMLFVHYFIPETKNKSLKEIQDDMELRLFQ